ncbi:MAG: TetR family transcriptional regulator C-terminal domain-containing protein [Betaproteobacteria bacterium]|nr:TetR family transcriptional regulator C-terminal domain-containing protein [Betaproteobacteria bacterium]
MTSRTPKPTAQRRTPRRPSANSTPKGPRKLAAKAAAAPRPENPPHSLKAQSILAAAETLFARFGFEGVALEAIATEAGISRHNLLYYFPSKEALYRKVLDEVMDRWLECMRALSVSSDPQEALSAYIAAKLKFSREHPAGSQVFTREVAAGAPRYADVIEQRVAPMLREDLKTLDKWAKEGRIERIDFTHLMFLIWSVTQAYADLAPQFALLLGKPKLEDKDFAAAEKVVTRLVIEGLRK